MRDPQILDVDFFSRNGLNIQILAKSAEHHGNVPLHYHSFFEFVYVVTGFTLHYHNGHSSVLTPGDLFAVAPNEVHSYTSAHHTKLYNVLFVLDEIGPMKDEILGLPGLWNIQGSSSDSPILHIDISDRAVIQDIIEKMIEENENRKVGWELRLRCLLVEFLILYSRLFCKSQNEKTDSSDNYYGYIYKALEFIEKNYAGDIDSTDISDYSGISVDYMSKQFKNALEMSPSEYIRKYRTIKAMELLSTTNMSELEISESVGLGNLSQFSRVFKAQTGISPSQYRKTINNTQKGGLYNE